MANKLQITDGTTTVDLSQLTTSWIKEYSPQPLGEDDRASESMAIVFKNTTLSNVFASIRNVETLFLNARSGGRVAPVYLQFNSETGTQTEMRALVYDGSVEYQKPLQYGVIDFRFECNIDLVRGQWQAASEVQQALTNRNGSGVTTALTVENCDDSSHDNFVEISSANVATTTDAPVRLELTDTTSAGTLSKIFCGLGAFQTFADFPNKLEGEDSTAGGTITVDANCSGGNYMYVNGTIGAGDTISFRWALTSAQAIACAGRRYHVLARFQTLPAASTYIAPALTLTAGTTALHPTSSIALTTADYVQYLGALTIPPSIGGATSANALDLVLLCKKTGGSGSLKLDCIWLFPSDGGFVIYNALTSGLVNTDILQDDGSAGVEAVYQTTSGGLRSYNWQRIGAPLRIIPGKTQRLYFAFVKSDATAAIANTATLKVYYRPTRQTL